MDKRKFLTVLTILSSFCVFVTAYLDIEIREVKQISGQEIVDFSNMKIKKINKTARAIIGTFTVLASNIDNTMLTDGFLLKKQGGEYQKLPYTLPKKNICDVMREDTYTIPDIVKVSDLPSPLPCPLEPRNYTVRGYVPNFPDLPLHLLSSGDYAVECLLYKDGKEVLSIIIYGALISI